MIDLSSHSSHSKPILLKDISRRLRVSLKYLDHIITSLKCAGFIKNARGGHGGYILSRPPNKIYVSEIVEALEGSLSPLECVDMPHVCRYSKNCGARKIWQKMKESLKNALNINLNIIAK